MKWIEDRLKERTTLDGIIMVILGCSVFLLPAPLLGAILVGYGVYTIGLEG